MCLCIYHVVGNWKGKDKTASYSCYYSPSENPSKHGKHVIHAWREEVALGICYFSGCTSWGYWSRENIPHQVLTFQVYLNITTVPLDLMPQLVEWSVWWHSFSSLYCHLKQKPQNIPLQQGIPSIVYVNFCSHGVKPLLHMWKWISIMFLCVESKSMLLYRD